jgi:hypothetical protein
MKQFYFLSSYRSAAWATIASGTIGIISYGFLVAYLVYRNETESLGILMQRFHDVGVSFQFLLMIPAAFVLYNLSQKLPPGISKSILNTGVLALLFTALCLLLIFPKLVSDGLYFFPQGIFGAWLIIINWRLSSILSRGIRWFGMIVGLGLAIVGIFFVGYVIFVSTIILQIPAAPMEEVIKIPMTPANYILHYFIWIGSFMGVLTLPFWTLLLGRTLLRMRSAYA